MFLMENSENEKIVVAHDGENGDGDDDDNCKHRKGSAKTFEM